jgi:predicted helicase
MSEFDQFTSIAQKGKAEHKGMFSTYSLGVNTARDAFLYAFSPENLDKKVATFVKQYNTEVDRYRSNDRPKNKDEFFDYSSLKWSRNLKRRAGQGRKVEFDPAHIRGALYRPYTHMYVYVDPTLVDESGQNPKFYPVDANEPNVTICISDKEHRTPFSALATDRFPDLHLSSAADAFQTFPFYTYDEDGSNRRENITDWALAEFRGKLQPDRVQGSAASLTPSPVAGKGKKSGKDAGAGAGTGQGSSASLHTDMGISKWDIFYYVYDLLHHPEYRTKYVANLRRELPRIPIVGDVDTFWRFSDAGKQLAELHVNYESQKEYPLEESWAEGSVLDLRVEKMKLTKDKTAIVYNDKLTLRGIPPEAFDYRLGNRSAIDWIIDQYQVSTDKRSGITNDPNREDDEQYI